MCWNFFRKPFFQQASSRLSSIVKAICILSSGISLFLHKRKKNVPSLFSLLLSICSIHPPLFMLNGLRIDVRVRRWVVRRPFSGPYNWNIERVVYLCQGRSAHNLWWFFIFRVSQIIGWCDVSWFYMRMRLWVELANPMTIFSRSK